MGCLRPASLASALCSVCSLGPPSLGCFSNELASSPLSPHPQLKISFSETALETTYQYPSESSVLEDLGPEPETPSAPTPLATQPDDDEEEEEEELLLQPGLQGGLRTKALIVGEQLAGGGRPLVSVAWRFAGAWPNSLLQMESPDFKTRARWFSRSPVWLKIPELGQTAWSMNSSLSVAYGVIPDPYGLSFNLSCVGCARPHPRS